MHSLFSRWVLMLVLTLWAPLAQAAPQFIADDAALRGAVAQGVQGKVLALAPGVYGPLVFAKGRAPAAITSADAANPAVLQGLQIRDFKDLRIQGVVLAYPFDPADKVNVRPFTFHKGKGLQLIGNRVRGALARGTGTLADGHGYGIGLSVRFAQDVRIEGNLISHHHRGLIVSESRNVRIAGNELTHLRMDGMTFAQVRDIRIENNHIHSFDRVLNSSDHSDMIQFWTASTKEPSRDIVIRGNLLRSGNGAFTQSIFMRNELVDKGQAGREMFYQNVLIEQNIIINAHLHGITLGETAGLTIRNNTLVQNPRSAGGNPGEWVWIPTVRVAKPSTRVTIKDNILGDARNFAHTPGWQISGNLVVVPRIYGQVFAGWPKGAAADPATYRLRPGLPAVGAAQLARPKP